MNKEDVLAKMVGVSGNTISSIETGQFNPTAKLILILCIALEKNLKTILFFKVIDPTIGLKKQEIKKIEV